MEKECPFEKALKKLKEYDEGFEERTMEDFEI